MSENIKTEQESCDLQELLECCDNISDSLCKFSDQLAKIIEVKKKAANSLGGNTALNQEQDVLSSTANLEKINVKLTSAISEVRQLCQQALMLTQRFDSRAEEKNENSMVERGLEPGGKAN
ncbi:MAG: hypothetical protein ACD_21C00067G0013 [uncultured bacterium]|nr:MAG: hypothetical protein ACD_21C00067G0013 [uncultured bacterium]